MVMRKPGVAVTSDEIIAFCKDRDWPKRDSKDGRPATRHQERGLLRDPHSRPTHILAFTWVSHGSALFHCGKPTQNEAEAILPRSVQGRVHAILFTAVLAARSTAS